VLLEVSPSFSTPLLMARRNFGVIGLTAGASTGRWSNLLSDSQNRNLSDPSRLLGLPPFRRQQVRWKRRDGNKAFDRPRPPTKKQRKTYNRKLQAMQEEQARRPPPGSKAGIRREWARMVRNDLINPPPDTIEDEDELLSYAEDDALLDDLMGNTATLSVHNPSPRPEYLGHKYEHYHRQALAMLRQRGRSGRGQQQQYDNNGVLAAGGQDQQQPSEVPALAAVSSSSSLDDRILSLALRSHRDRHGTKSRPIGLVKALDYLLQELRVSVSELGEMSFTSLLTCCRTPLEGRRVLDWQLREGRVPVSEYSWSILVDLHARVGDFRGCDRVMREMLEQGSVAPTLAAYTSLLSACARVCRNKRVAHTVRSEAARLGWEKWQDMRVVGLDPDVMAYGAILALTAAVGQPERALNLLEEMTDHFHIKPTTYCYASALRAVAKSHSTAIRYERGSSRRNKRREFLTKHHGMLAREIVIRAEAAEVKQDDGFVSALILCAAAAGDAATAKAIYLASQIRRLDELRTIGPDAHLARLRGEDLCQPMYPEERMLHATGAGATSEVSPATVGGGTSVPSPVEVPWAFEEREYGKDSRVLSAVLHACSRAVSRNGIGTMWQGRENDGYLCDNSLRLLVARRVPRYEDKSIPGQTRTADLTWEGEYKEDEYRGGNKRRSRKFSGIEASKNAAADIDDLDGAFRRIYVDEEGRLKSEFRSTTPDDIWRMKYGNDDDAMAMLDIANNRAKESETRVNSNVPQLSLDNPGEEMYFDSDTTRGTTRVVYSHAAGDTNDVSVAVSTSESSVDNSTIETEELVFNTDTMRWEVRQAVISEAVSTGRSNVVEGDINERTMKGENYVEEDEELYFDDDSMRWKTQPRSTEGASLLMGDVSQRTELEARILKPSSVLGGQDERSPVSAQESRRRLSIFVQLPHICTLPDRLVN
jgi:pentatricopeptide repeat protein